MEKSRIWTAVYMLADEPCGPPKTCVMRYESAVDFDQADSDAEDNLGESAIVVWLKSTDDDEAAIAEYFRHNTPET